MWGKRRVVGLERCQRLSIKTRVRHFYHKEEFREDNNGNVKSLGELNVHFVWDFRYKRSSIDSSKLLVAAFAFVTHTLSHDEFSILTFFVSLRWLGPSFVLSLLFLSVVARFISSKHSAAFFLGDLCSKAFSYSPLSPGLNPEPFGNRRVTCVAAFSPPTLQEVEGYAATRE